ncbi:MAG: PAS domain-containing protein [Proteobacteria bacterium]|nr:PAS domain-containing protein [Pseudomonadota bacterium]
MGLISLLDAFSMSGFIVAAVFSLRIPEPTLGNPPRILLFLAMCLYALIGFFNLLEHTRVTAIFDPFEDYLEILFVPLLLFFLFSFRSALAHQEKDRALEALEKSEDKYRLIVENQNDLVVTLDNERRLVFASPSYCQLFGKSEADLLGRSFLPLVHEDDREIVSRSIEELYRPPYTCFHEERAMSARGWRWLAWSNRAVLDEEGRVTRIIAVGRDVTDRKEAEEAFRESQTRFRLLLDSTAEAIYGLDTEGRCTFVNPACLRLLAYDRQEDLIGRNMHDLIHHTRPDGSAYPMDECRIFSAFKRGEGSHVDDEVLWRSDGAAFPAEYWSFPVYSNGRITGAVVTFLDITERRHAEQEKENLIKKLQAALAEVHTLQGFIPICANCKKIRDDEGYWQQIEQYIQDRSAARFSHGICPECRSLLYPGFPNNNE